jgi:FMN phosphatase YigB (HAD superfamily)
MYDTTSKELICLAIKAVFFDLFETLISEYANGTRLTGRPANYLELIGVSNEEYKKEWGSRQQRRMLGVL